MTDPTTTPASTSPNRRNPARRPDSLRREGVAEAHYALDNLPNKILAAEYQTVLPDEKTIANELERSRRELEQRRLLPGGSE